MADEHGRMCTPDWFCDAEGGSNGPYASHELVEMRKRGHITAKTQVYSKTVTNGVWVTYESVAAKLEGASRGNPPASRENAEEVQPSAFVGGGANPTPSQTTGNGRTIVIVDESPAHSEGSSKKWFILIAVVLFGWFAFNKFQNARAERMTRQIAQLIGELRAILPLIDEIGGAQGFALKKEEFNDLKNRGLALQNQGRLSESLRTFEEAMAKASEMIESNQLRLMAAKLVQEATNRRFAPLEGEPALLVSEISKQNRNLASITNLFEQARFDEAGANAVLLARDLEILQKTHVEYWKYREVLRKTDLRLLADYGGLLGGQIVGATTNLAALGNSLQEISTKLRNLSGEITNALQVAYLEKDKAIARESEAVIQGATRAEALARLRDWMATAPSLGLGVKLFNSQAREFSCWFSWAEAEAAKETNTYLHTQAKIELVRLWRDLAVLLKEYPDRVNAAALGKNYNQVSELFNEAAESALKSSEQISDVKARLTLVLDLRDVVADAPSPPDMGRILDTCENLFLVLEKGMSKFDHPVTSYAFAQNAGIAARHGDIRRAGKLINRAMSMNAAVSISVIYALNKGNVEEALDRVSAIPQLNHEEAAISYSLITLEAARRGMRDVVEKTEPLAMAHWDSSSQDSLAWDSNGVFRYPLKDVVIAKLAVADLYLRETRRSMDRSKLIRQPEIQAQYNAELAASLVREKKLESAIALCISRKGHRSPWDTHLLVPLQRLEAKAKALGTDVSASELARWISEGKGNAERSAAMSGIAFIYALK